MVEKIEQLEFFLGTILGLVFYIMINFFSSIWEFNQAVYDIFPFSLFKVGNNLMLGWSDDLAYRVFLQTFYTYTAIAAIILTLISEILYYVRIIPNAHLPTFLAGFSSVFTLGLLISIINGTAEITSLI